MKGGDSIPYPEEDVKWSSSFFNKINVGGLWSVPRSGLTFRKLNEKTFVLDHVMPWAPGITATKGGREVPGPDKEGLLEFQRQDYQQISGRFEAAGINMFDPKNLLNRGTMKEETSNVKLGEGGKSASDHRLRPFCSICGEIYEGSGNNALPINAGRCCDKCDATVVTPERIWRATR